MLQAIFLPVYDNTGIVIGLKYLHNPVQEELDLSQIDNNPSGLV